jgi:hypothetical protein
MAHKENPNQKDVPTPISSNLIYTIEQAAAVLDCNVRVLADKFKAGDIRAKKKLGKWYTIHANLLSFIES